MSKNLFTPGPWDKRGSKIIGFFCGKDRVVADVKVADPEGQANGQLIAAAPRLYEDLQAAASQLRKYEVLHTLKNTPDSLEKARVNAELAERFESTLAAARGEA